MVITNPIFGSDVTTKIFISCSTSSLCDRFSVILPVLCFLVRTSLEEDTIVVNLREKLELGISAIFPDVT